MSSETRTLGEFIDVKHGFAFSGDHIVSDQTDRILMTPGHFKIGGGFCHNHKKFYDTDDYRDGYELESGDLVVTMTDLSKAGDTLGYSAIVPSIEGKILLHNQRIGKVTSKGDELDIGFCHYLLRGRLYRQHILATCTGSTVKHTSPKKILEYEFNLPNKATQKAIVHILGTLDDKIELNRQINETLEAMAQAIFKDWFVDFGPVRRKQSGETDSVKILGGLIPDSDRAASIAALFPDRLDEQGKPEGWEGIALKQIGDVITGKTPSTRKAEYYGHEVPFLKIPDMHKQMYVLKTATSLSCEGAKCGASIGCSDPVSIC